MIFGLQGATTVNAEPTIDAPPPAKAEAEAAAVLPAPDYVSGDPIAMMAKLFVKSAQQKRESDSLTATTEEHAEDVADAKRIEAMKDKADKTLMAGFVGGSSQAAGGVCSMKSQGAGDLTSGLGKVGESLFKHEADAADRDVVKAETEGKVAKRAQDALHKEVDAATQHEGKVIQLLQEIKQAQAQSERAALLRA